MIVFKTFIIRIWGSVHFAELIPSAKYNSKDDSFFIRGIVNAVQGIYDFEMNDFHCISGFPAGVHGIIMVDRTYLFPMSYG